MHVNHTLKDNSATTLGYSRVTETIGNTNINELDLLTIFRSIREGYSIILGSLVVTFVIAVLYLMSATSYFTASSTILVDPYRRGSALADAPLSDSPVDTAIVDTQVELIKSEAVERRAITKLGNSAGRLILGAPKSSSLPKPIFRFVEWVKTQLARGAGEGQTDLMQDYLTALNNSLFVKRTGLTFIIAISFRGETPAGAAQVANALADSYLEDQINAKVAAAQRMSETLTQRASALQSQASLASRRVQTYQGGDQVTLQQLNAAATVARAALELFQRRAIESEQAGANSVSDARLVSPAFPPPKRSWPRSIFVLGGATLVGLLIGMSLAYLRLLFARVYRTVGDVEADFQVCISNLRLKRWWGVRRRQALGLISSAEMRNRIGGPRYQLSNTIGELAAHVDIFSGASERVSIGVLSLQSALTGDLLAYGLANSLADCKNTLLIDANKDSRFLTEALNLTEEPQTIVSDQRNIDTTHEDRAKGPVLCGLSLNKRQMENLTPNKVRSLINLDTTAHPIVIVSFSESNLGEISAWLLGLDAFVVCIEHGRTRRKTVRCMAKLPGFRTRCLGAILCRS